MVQETYSNVNLEVAYWIPYLIPLCAPYNVPYHVPYHMSPTMSPTICLIMCPYHALYCVPNMMLAAPPTCQAWQRGCSQGTCPQ